MQSSPRLPLWAGRTAALVGIILFTLSIRYSIAAVSPIFAQISVDIPLSNTAIGVLGALPPLMFAIFGLLGPAIVRRLGLERALFLSMGLETAGHILRAFSPNLAGLLVSTSVVLIGMGIGNVLLPGIVKRYFPDRIGLVTSIYAPLIAVSAAIPPAIAVPLADGLGWRFSLGIWAAFSGIAFVPWIVVAVRRRRPLADGSEEIEEPPSAVVGKLWRSKTALAMTLGFALCAIGVYGGYGWLPTILVDIGGATPAQSGALLSIWSLLGTPVSLVVPILAARLRNVGWIYLAGGALALVGWGGLALAPSAAPIVWTTITGLSPVMFSGSLALIGLRSRTHEGAVALGGFVQGVGYAVAAIGPLLVGLLHDLSHGWVVPLLFLAVSGIAMIVPAIAMAKPRFIEDELAEHPAAAR